MPSGLDIDYLSQQIHESLSAPLSPVGESALAAFLDLPGVAEWHPENFFLRELSDVFDVGLPFALIGNNSSVGAHKRKIGKAVKHLPAPLPNDWSEVQAGAILSSKGMKVSFVKRRATAKQGSSTTPDLEIHSTSGLTVDVEVTRGETRQLHEAVKNALEKLSGALRPSDVDWHVLCFFADASKSDNLNAVLDAAVTLRPGELKEVPNRWAVRAVPLECRDDVMNATVSKLFGPDWWPSDEPCYRVDSTLFPRPIPPVIALRSLIPETSYMNPLRNKADSGQRRPGNPYLIALDAENLLGANERIPRELASYFSTRDQVSGVMLFDNRFWIGVHRKEWLVSVHMNPHPRYPLPSELLLLADGKRHSLQFELSKQ